MSRNYRVWDLGGGRQNCIFCQKMALPKLLLGSAPSRVMTPAQLCPPSVRWATFLPSTARTPGPVGELGWCLRAEHDAAGKGDLGTSPPAFRGTRRQPRKKQQAMGTGRCTGSALGMIQGCWHRDAHLFPAPWVGNGDVSVPPCRGDGVRESTGVLGKTQRLAALPKRGPQEGAVATSPANLSIVISLIAPLLKQKKREELVWAFIQHDFSTPSAAMPKSGMWEKQSSERERK